MVAWGGPRTTSLARSPLGSLQKKERKGFNFAQTPFLVTPKSLAVEGMCSRKIYPFPTQMSLPDQLLQGQAELNPRPLLPAPSQVPAQGSLRSPPYNLYNRGPGSRPRPARRAAAASRGGPGQGGSGRPREYAPDPARATTAGATGLLAERKDGLTLTLIS